MLWKRRECFPRISYLTRTMVKLNQGFNVTIFSWILQHIRGKWESKCGSARRPRFKGIGCLYAMVYAVCSNSKCSVCAMHCWNHLSCGKVSVAAFKSQVARHSLVLQHLFVDLTTCKKTPTSLAQVYKGGICVWTDCWMNCYNCCTCGYNNNNCLQ
jgi:hypothetical protein